MYSNMIELTHHMNETIVKSQQTPDCSAKEAKLNTIKWKNLSIKYVKQVKTLESAIFQKQKDLDKSNDLAGKKHGGKGYGKNGPDEMTELIEPELTGEEDEYDAGPKQRVKAPVQGETFEEFMRRRSKRIGKFMKYKSTFS
jgi:hypothetical protein